MSVVLSNGGKPRIILGLMIYGPDVSAGARITDLEEYKALLTKFQERGYGEVDTARLYVDGKQEAFTRAAGWRERGLTLATKVLYPNVAKGKRSTAQGVRESVMLSLSELGTEMVDILYLHAADRSTPFAETLAEMDRLHKEGKFVRLGLSNFTAFEVAEVFMLCKANGWVRPTIYQGMYNAILRNIEPELIPALRRYGLDLVVYNPLAGGLLSGKIKSKDITPDEGRFSDKSSTGKSYRKRYYSDATFKALQTIEAAVERHAAEGLTMIETPLRWVMHHSKLRIGGMPGGSDGNDGVLIGASSIKQLEENLDALEKGPLPDDVVKALDEAWQVAKVESPPYWHLDLEYSYDTREALLGEAAL